MTLGELQQVLSDEELSAFGLSTADTERSMAWLEDAMNDRLDDPSSDFE
jgi:hypothetical protein